MKSNSILRNPLILTVPMALLLQASVLAQALPPPQGIGISAGSNGLAFWKSVDFYFPGGSPKQFLNAVDKQYKVDWSSIADIPPEMRDVRIPALRLNRESVLRILSYSEFGKTREGGRVGGGSAFITSLEERNPLDALVALYNSLWQARPNLGQMIVEGDFVRPSIVIFRSSNPNPPIGIKMKAFALKGIPKTDWEMLARELKDQFKLLAEWNREENAASPPSTDVAIHFDTGLLVVVGPQSDVEVAESLIGAWHDNHPAGEENIKRF